MSLLTRHYSEASHLIISIFTALAFVFYNFFLVSQLPFAHGSLYFFWMSLAIFTLCDQTCSVISQIVGLVRGAFLFCITHQRPRGNFICGRSRPEYSGAVCLDATAKYLQQSAA